MCHLYTDDEILNGIKSLFQNKTKIWSEYRPIIFVCDALLLCSDGDTFSVSGQLKSEEADLTLHYGYSEEKVLITRSYTLKTSDAAACGASCPMSRVALVMSFLVNQIITVSIEQNSSADESPRTSFASVQRVLCFLFLICLSLTSSRLQAKNTRMLSCSVWRQIHRSYCPGSRQIKYTHIALCRKAAEWPTIF